MIFSLLIMSLFLWAGMILGISFLESWVKFKTPTLTKVIGLDVGRTVFHAFHQVQVVLLGIVIVSGALSQLTGWDWFCVSMIAILLMLQLAWLFPMLSKRVSNILAGESVPASYAHACYGLFEVIKLFFLIGLGLRLIG